MAAAEIWLITFLSAPHRKQRESRKRVKLYTPPPEFALSDVLHPASLHLIRVHNLLRQHLLGTKCSNT